MQTTQARRAVRAVSSVLGALLPGSLDRGCLPSDSESLCLCGCARARCRGCRAGSLAVATPAWPSKRQDRDALARSCRPALRSSAPAGGSSAVASGAPLVGVHDPALRASSRPSSGRSGPVPEDGGISFRKRWSCPGTDSLGVYVCRGVAGARHTAWKSGPDLPPSRRVRP
jgi:hypothetical protein